MSSLLLFALVLFAATDSIPSAVPNENRVPAGARVGDTLVLRLVATSVRWYIHTEREPALAAVAFAEEGKAPTIPGPLLRVRAGTPVRVVVRNPFADSLIVHGLGPRGDGVPDSLIVLPGAGAEARFVAGRPGNFVYWGVTTAMGRSNIGARGFDAQFAAGRTIVRRRGPDTQLTGAYVVDPATGPLPRDRILVLTAITDAFNADGVQPRDRSGFPAREFVAINGKSWPNTERITAAVGDSLHWRVLNGSMTPHPMHLHGFYFRVDSRGDDTADSDTLYAPKERRMAVTEVLFQGQTMSIAWSPDRPGGWLFHCHLTPHMTLEPPLGHPQIVEIPSEHDHADPDRHAFTGMNGMILAALVHGPAPAHTTWRPTRRLRLYVQTDSQPGDTLRRYGYVLRRGAEPRRDSVEYPGPSIVLTRGEATIIEVINRADEPTAVHWHGMEVDNYFDGVVGLGRAGVGTTPAIRPNATFSVHLAPKRAGTFMYHTHYDELRQQYGGLVGAIVVLEPGERWNALRDHVVLVTDKGSGNPRHLWINGSIAPTPIELRVGETHRFRIANITVNAPSLRLRLTHDTSRIADVQPYAGDSLPWRMVAKDGWPVSASRSRPRAGTSFVGTGETADFEITADRPDAFALEFFFADTDRKMLMVSARIPLRVVPGETHQAGDAHPTPVRRHR
jgi:FtsP/CotA-like multicopper oxidase with cupredoxin domain